MLFFQVSQKYAKVEAKQRYYRHTTLPAGQVFLSSK